MIPFVDLNRQYVKYKEQIDHAIKSTLEESRFILGAAVNGFENSLAEYLGIDHVVSCGSGTDALELILQAYGIGAGDEVILPAFTWVSNAEAVCNVGATPVFIDVKENTYNLNADQLENLISPKTKAIMAVHLYGLSCDMDRIMELANAHNIIVIEDVAQALGASYKGNKLGAIGHVAAHSFYPTKNLGAFGDAGAISTNDGEIADKIRLITNHGQTSRDVHVLNGRNSRMDTLQAAILEEKLKYLDEMNDIRRGNALHYNECLRSLNIGLPQGIDSPNHSNHIYAIRSDQRDELKSHMAESGVNTAIHYPTALPYMLPYAKYAEGQNFPIARRLSKEELSLPVFPGLTQSELADVVNATKEFFK